jgi:PIN like domain
LPPDSPPELFIDRIGQELRDEEWLRDAGEREWVVLMKDARIRRRPAELEVLAAHHVRAFCLTNANLRTQIQSRGSGRGDASPPVAERASDTFRPAREKQSPERL